MNLQKLEKKIGVKFPSKWRKIYQTGAMKWLELSKKIFSSEKNNCIYNPNSFMILNCDCELILFDEIPKQIQKLKRWIKEREQDEGSEFDKRITLIPFGQSAAGDLYCFLYENEENFEPKVVLYMHDEYGNPDIIGENFDEFLYIQMLSAVAYEEDVQGQHWQNHLNWLLESYRKMIENKSVDELINMYDALTYKQAAIWIFSTSYDNIELEPSILLNSNRDYTLKINFYKIENFRTDIFQNAKYHVIGYYENEEQLICVSENQQIYLIVKYDDLICYVAPNLKSFQQEIRLFETLTKECKLIDKISYTDENTEDILQEISDILKRDILKIDSNAFDNIENFWSEICIEIEDGIIFT